MQKQRRIDLSKGYSQLYGLNIGKYPEHHFFELPQPELWYPYPIYVNACGYDLMCRGVFRQRKNCDVCSFELVTEGEIRYVSNGTTYICRPGDIFIMHRHSNNRLECISPLAKVYNVGYGGEMLGPMLEHLGLSSIEFIHLPDLEQYLAIFEKAAKAGMNYSIETFPELVAMGYEVLLRLSRLVGTHKSPNNTLEKILAYLHSHIDVTLQTHELCQLFSISRMKLFRLFRTQIGVSPTEYLIRLRMKAAKQMLVESNLSIKEIAMQCGYSNQLYFSLAFKKCNGCSPSRFRQGGQITKAQFPMGDESLPPHRE